MITMTFDQENNRVVLYGAGAANTNVAATPANIAAVMRQVAGKPVLIDRELYGLFEAPATARIAVPRLIPPLRICKTAPWRHQLEAAYLGSRYQGLCLAMAMGTGKTKAACDIIQNAGIRRILVIAPKAVVPNWPDEIGVHCVSDYAALVLAVNCDKSSAYRAAQAKAHMDRYDQEYGLPIWLIVDHATCWRDGMADLLFSHAWDAIIVDESHKICNPDNKLSQFVYQLAARNPKAKRLALTGTPLKQRPLEVYGIAQFVAPDLLPGGKYTFERTYGVFESKTVRVVPKATGLARDVQIEQFHHLKDEDAFAQFLAGFLFRVDKSVLKDLPPATHVRRYFSLSATAQKLYTSMRNDWQADYEGLQVETESAATRLMRLMQISGGHISQDGETRSFDSGKRELLEQLLQEPDLEHRPLVIFAHFVEDLATIESVCKKLGIAYLEQSGRRNQWQAWQGGAAQVLGVQAQSGGAGITLTRASEVIYYSKGRSIVDYDQSLSRSHRAGQKNSVTYIHLLAQNTVDVDAYEALNSGMDVLDYLMQQTAKIVKTATKEKKVKKHAA